jgi:hypothetical protein
MGAVCGGDKAVADAQNKNGKVVNNNCRDNIISDYKFEKLKLMIADDRVLSVSDIQKLIETEEV